MRRKTTLSLKILRLLETIQGGGFPITPTMTSDNLAAQDGIGFDDNFEPFQDEDEEIMERKLDEIGNMTLDNLASVILKAPEREDLYRIDPADVVLSVKKSMFLSEFIAVARDKQTNKILAKVKVSDPGLAKRLILKLLSRAGLSL